MYGYAGQGYPIYGQPDAEGPHADAAPQVTPEGAAPDEPASDAAREEASSEPALDPTLDAPSPMPWLADPTSSAFAFGYTTSLGASSPPPSSRGHAGKGPKDYLRADSRVREEVCERLSDDDAVDAREISVEVRAGEVVLSGAVLDRYSKRRAEEIATRVPGVVDVRNHLHVQTGLWHELGAELTGSAEGQHHGHHGSGPRQS